MSIRTRSEAFSTSESDSSFSRDHKQQILDSSLFDAECSVAESEIESNMDTIEVKKHMDELEKRFSQTLTLTLQSSLATFKVEVLREVKEEIEKSTSTWEDRIQILEETSDNQKKEIEALTKIQKENQDKIKTMSKDITLARQKGVENEQYSRRFNLRIFNLPEVSKKNPYGPPDLIGDVQELISSKLRLAINREDIVVAHRLPGKTPRPVIVRLASKDIRHEIISRRKVLKDKGISIAEDLCQDILTTVNRFRNDKKIKDAWTWNGKIYVQHKDTRVEQARWGQTFEELFPDPPIDPKANKKSD